MQFLNRFFGPDVKASRTRSEGVPAAGHSPSSAWRPWKGGT